MTLTNLTFRIVFIAMALMFMITPVFAQNETVETAENLMLWQLSSLKEGNLQRFTEHGNRMFKEFMNEYSFDSLKMQRTAKLAKGYKLEYLGSISRIGMQQHLWKVHITGEKYQLLGSLSLSHGMVVGFTLD